MVSFVSRNRLLGRKVERKNVQGKADRERETALEGALDESKCNPKIQICTVLRVSQGAAMPPHEIGRYVFKIPDTMPTR